MAEPIQDGPVRYGIAAIKHCFGFTVRACHRPGIQMISSDNNRRFNLAGSYKLIKSKTCFLPVALPDPVQATPLVRPRPRPAG